MPKDSDIQLSLSAHAARNLATATVTPPQWDEISPRWLLKLLPYVDVDGGALPGEPGAFRSSRTNRRSPDCGRRASRKLPATFVDYEKEPREYHLSTIQTILHTHTRITDLYSDRIDQLREQVRLTVEAVKEREEWELLNHPEFGILKIVAPQQRIKTRHGAPTPGRSR